MRKMVVMAMISGCLSIPLVAFAQPVGGDDLVFTSPSAPPVMFSHHRHLQERGLKCSGCHYQFFQMAQRAYKMDMGKITKGEFCGRCHNGLVSFDVQDPKICCCCHQ